MADAERRARLIIEAKNAAGRELENLTRQMNAATRGHFDMAKALNVSGDRARVFANQALAGLNQQLAAGKIGATEYAQAVERTQLKFGMASQASLQASSSIAKLNTDFAAGKMSSAQYADGIAKIEKEARKTISPIERMRESMGGLAMVAKAALVGGLTMAGMAAVKMGMQFEQTQIAFKTLLGSTEAASKHLAELRDFAAKTPFQFTDLVTASRRLQAFGFEAEKIIPMLRDIGDAVAAMGGGSEMIDRVTLALGQMSAKGKVSAQEMLQLTEAGIPAWRFLAEAMGVTTAEVQKMSERGLIPAGKAIDAILTGMRKDFGGMMAEQSKTAAGQLSNLIDQFESAATTLGTALLPTIKSVVEAGVKLISAFNALPDPVKQGAIAFLALSVALKPITSIGAVAIDVIGRLGGGLLSAARGAGTFLSTGGQVVGYLKEAGAITPMLIGKPGLLGAGLGVVAKYL